jgi:hypothetical protein
MPSLRNSSASNAKTSSTRWFSPSIYPTGLLSRSSRSLSSRGRISRCLAMMVFLLPRAGDVSPAEHMSQQQAHAYSQSTIVRPPDALAETCWSEIQELPPVRHVLLRTAYDTQVVPSQRALAVRPNAGSRQQLCRAVTNSVPEGAILEECRIEPRRPNAAGGVSKKQSRTGRGFGTAAIGAGGAEAAAEADRAT